MRTHLALLRGINVGGRNRVSMADLRDIVVSLGHTEVATYIQSGNAVFAARDPGAETALLAQALEDGIAEQLEVGPAVIVVTARELGAVVRENPFPEETEPKALHAVFLRDVPAASRLEEVEAAVERARAQGGRDEARVVGRTLYMRTPGGIGRSRLAAELSRREGRMDRAQAGTARNWATVLALMRLMEA